MPNHIFGSFNQVNDLYNMCCVLEKATVSKSQMCKKENVNGVSTTTTNTSVGTFPND